MAVLRESPWYEEIKQEGIQQVARNLLATGMDPAQIAAVSGLTLVQVQQLQVRAIFVI
jgi:predicted transposase YdaD